MKPVSTSPPNTQGQSCSTALIQAAFGDDPSGGNTRAVPRVDASCPLESSRIHPVHCTGTLCPRIRFLRRPEEREIKKKETDLVRLKPGSEPFQNRFPMPSAVLGDYC